MTSIGYVLLELKAKKSELKRLQDLRKTSFKHYDNEDAPEMSFEAVTKQIAVVLEDLRKLKIRIEETNHSTTVDTSEGKMSIAEAIHFIGDMRSELACLEGLREKYEREHSWSDDAKRKAIYQLKRARIRPVWRAWPG